MGVWTIAEDEGWYFNHHLLTRRVQERIDGYKSVQRKLQGVAVRILIKELLPDEENVAIDYDKKSKPFFVAASYKLSISHSGDMVAVLISKKGEVGVDIEKRSEKIERISGKFMNTAEKIKFDGLIGAERTKYLHILWGAKESMFKLYGKGSLDFKRHLKVQHFQLTEDGHFKGSIEKEQKPIQIEGFYSNVGKFVLVYVLESKDY